MNQKQIAQYVSKVLYNRRLHYAYVLSRVMHDCKIEREIVVEILDNMIKDGVIFEPVSGVLEWVRRW